MGKYLVKKTKAGYRFVLKAGNGEIIAVSEIYSSEAACLKGVDRVRSNALKANLEYLTDNEAIPAKNPKFEIYADRSGEFRFRLKARNGEVIAASEGYKSKNSCLRGIESVRKNAVDAGIEKDY